jgi:hypothetical protein
VSVRQGTGDADAQMLHRHLLSDRLMPSRTCRRQPNCARKDGARASKVHFVLQVCPYSFGSLARSPSPELATHDDPSYQKWARADFFCTGRITWGVRLHLCWKANERKVGIPRFVIKRTGHQRIQTSHSRCWNRRNKIRVIKTIVRKSLSHSFNKESDRESTN